jgi:hypothetical protein
MAVTVGEGSFSSRMKGVKRVRVGVSRELKLEGVAVAGMDDLPGLHAERVHPSPRIQTRLMAIGIRRARSNEK